MEQRPESKRREIHLCGLEAVKAELNRPSLLPFKASCVHVLTRPSVLFYALRLVAVHYFFGGPFS